MTKEENIYQVELNKIEHGDNYRHTYDQTEMLTLMTTMKHEGQLQQIGVHKIGAGRFRIIWGHRRYMAAERLGWKTIMAVILSEEMTEEDYMFKNLQENISRSSPSPMDEGIKFRALLNKNHTIPEIAKRLGISKDRVNNALHVLSEVPKEFQADIVYVQSGGAAPPGKIAGNAVNKIKQIAKTNNLGIAEKRILFSAAKKGNLPSSRVQTVGSFLGRGYSLEEAIEQASETRAITVSIVMTEAAITKIEKQTGGPITRELQRVLQDNFPTVRRSKKVYHRRSGASKPSAIAARA